MDMSFSAPSLPMNPLPPAAQGRLPGNMQNAAREFEAVFVGQMAETMFSGIEIDEPFGGGQAEGMWRSMLTQEIGRTIANSGGIGIADAVMRSMIEQQEAAQALDRPASEEK